MPSIFCLLRFASPVLLPNLLQKIIYQKNEQPANQSSGGGTPQETTQDSSERWLRVALFPLVNFIWHVYVPYVTACVVRREQAGTHRGRSPVRQLGVLCLLPVVCLVEGLGYGVCVVYLLPHTCTPVSPLPSFALPCNRPIRDSYCGPDIQQECQTQVFFAPPSSVGPHVGFLPIRASIQLPQSLVQFH